VKREDAKSEVDGRWERGGVKGGDGREEKRGERAKGEG